MVLALKKFGPLIPNLLPQHQTHVWLTTAREETRVLKERKYSRSKAEANCGGFLLRDIITESAVPFQYKKEFELFATRLVIHILLI